MTTANAFFKASFIECLYFQIYPSIYIIVLLLLFSVDFLEMLKDLKFDQTCRHYAIKNIMAIAVMNSDYFFCRSNKDWENPELMTF